MCQIALSKGHKETDSLNPRNIQCQTFNFLMMKKVHILLSYFFEIVFFLNFHRFCLYPVTVFPVRALCRNLPDVDFRIEIGGKRISVVTAVAVQNINIIDFVEFMFQGIGAEHPCYSRVKSTAQKRRNACFFKAFSICPLPAVLKLCRIFRLIVCSINVMGFGSQAGIHDSQILIRKSQIQNHIRFFLFD